MGRHHVKGGSECTLTVQLSRLGATVDYHPISATDLSRLHQFGPKVLPRFLGYTLHAEGIWKGDILVADIEELDEMDASEIYMKRLNAKDVFTPMIGEKLKLSIAVGTVKNFGWDQVLRTFTSIRDPDGGEERGNLHREPDGSSSTFVVVWWWCWERFLVHFKQHYLWLSRRTQSQTGRTEKRIIS